MRMFTYGTLKDPENLKDDGATNIIEDAFIKGYKLYSFMGGFPITKYTGDKKDVIYGTLFTMPKAIILGYYDILEGYDPDRSKDINMYNRVFIPVYTKKGITKAQFYEANEKHFTNHYTNKNLIKTGVWTGI